MSQKPRKIFDMNSGHYIMPVNEADTDNNIATLEVGMADVSIDNLKVGLKDGIVQLDGIIENNGFEVAENVRIEITDTSTDECILEDTMLVQALYPNSIQYFTYELPDKYWMLLDDSVRYELRVNVKTDSDDSRLGNNTGRVVFNDLNLTLVNAIGNTTIKLDQQEVVMNHGETVELKVNYYPTSVEGITATFYSDNPSVATIDEDGMLVALDSGDAVITAIATNGVVDVCHVHVRAYEDPTFVWNNDYTACFAEFANGNDIVTFDCNIEDVTIEATCIEDGLIIYTALVEADGNTFTDVKEVTIPAIGHHDNDGDLYCDICSERYGYKVTVTSELDSNPGISVASVSGGGIYEIKSDGVCDEATVTAPEILGYDFKGWYEGTEQMATSRVYAFVPERDIYSLDGFYFTINDFFDSTQYLIG